MAAHPEPSDTSRETLFRKYQHASHSPWISATPIERATRAHCLRHDWRGRLCRCDPRCGVIRHFCGGWHQRLRSLRQVHCRRFGVVDGVVIASIATTSAPGERIPIVGDIRGLEKLQADPAWGVVLAAASDSKLLDHLRASAPVAAPSCEDACRTDWPTPDDCVGPWDSYICRIVAANYDFCRRSCRCDSLGSPGAEARKSAAAAILILEELKCTAALTL